MNNLISKLQEIRVQNIAMNSKHFRFQFLILLTFVVGLICLSLPTKVQSRQVVTNFEAEIADTCWAMVHDDWAGTLCVGPLDQILVTIEEQTWPFPACSYRTYKHSGTYQQAGGQKLDVTLYLGGADHN